MVNTSGNTKNKISRCIVAALCALICVFQVSCIHQGRTAAIASGQSVKVSYACKLGSGELVSATNPETTRKLDPDPLSIFIGPGMADNVVIKAGDQLLPQNEHPGDKLRDFIAVLKNEIGKRIVGMTPGETRQVSIAAEDTPELSPEDRLIRMATRRNRKKIKNMSVSAFKKENGGSLPEVGKDMTRATEPWLKGVITEIDDKTVTITYSAIAGETVETPFGPAVVSDNGKEYIIDIKPVIGKPVRAGGFLGRIVSSEGDTFTIDFGNPFGGETVTCDVTAEGIQEKSEKIAENQIAPKASTILSDTPVASPVATENSMTVLAAKVVGSIDQAEKDDLVTFDYTLFDQNGELVMTSRRFVDENKEIKKSSGYTKPDFFRPAEIVLGKNEIIPFMEKAIYGMKEGEEKKVYLKPEEAYGKRDPQKIKTFSRVKALPEIIRISTEKFKDQFKFEPKVGAQIRIVPLFISEVASVEGDQVSIKHLVEDGTVVPGDMGATEIHIKDGKVVMTLMPNLGKQFDANGEKGIVTASDGASFVVDFNPLHAGEFFTLDVTVRSIVKKAQYQKNISWTAGLDDVFEKENTSHKPAVLILYASWCPWCKRLLTETLTDPRITVRAGDFLWCKIDTNKEKDIYKLYDQKSFPTVVFLDGNGKVVKKFDGFMNAVKLSQELNAVM